MSNTEFTPTQSLALITKVLLEAKTRFKDNGFAFIVIGFFVCVASLGQFILLKAEYYQVNYYPYFVMPLAGIITYAYYHKRGRVGHGQKNMISTMLSTLGIVIGLNAMAIGFLFWEKFFVVLFPIMFILLGLWAIVTGVAVRFKTIFYSGIVVNIIAYAAFFISSLYHPLLLSISALLAFVVPGIVMRRSQKNDDV